MVPYFIEGRSQAGIKIAVKCQDCWYASGSEASASIAGRCQDHSQVPGSLAGARKVPSQSPWPSNGVSRDVALV